MPRRFFAICRSLVSSALSISLEFGKSSDAPYATQSVWSIVAGGDARNEFDSEREHQNGVGAFAIPSDDGGGVISEADGGRSGDNRLALSEEVVRLCSMAGPSGEADRVAWDGMGVLGIEISAGVARDTWENFSSVSLLVMVWLIMTGHRQETS